MISEVDPRILLLVGFVLLITGFALPVLMIMRILPSTFLLNFIAYAASFVGLITGMLGALFFAMRSRSKRNRDR